MWRMWAESRRARLWSIIVSARTEEHLLALANVLSVKQRMWERLPRPSRRFFVAFVLLVGGFLHQLFFPREYGLVGGNNTSQFEDAPNPTAMALYNEAEATAFDNMTDSLIALQNMGPLELDTHWTQANILTPLNSRVLRRASPRLEFSGSHFISFP